MFQHHHCSLDRYYRTLRQSGSQWTVLQTGSNRDFHQKKKRYSRQMPYGKKSVC